FEQESGLETPVSLPTDTSLTVPTTVAMLPITSVLPVATPFEPFPEAEDTTPEQTPSILDIPRMTEAPVIPTWKATTTSTTTTDTTSTTVATPKPTTGRRFLPPFVTKAATTRATTLETPTTSLLQPSTPTEVAPTPLVPTSTAKPRSLPKPTPSRTADPTDKTSALPSTPATLPPTEAPQVGGRSPSHLLRGWGAMLEANSGPSGDFEIQEEEETTRPELGNEVMAVVTPPAGPGLGKNVESGLIDNTIDSGNSAAQLPQKNILERKEVLIAVIVGGVVGALFAAFLVMLLIYRMKKKDEGSYTLEEPKQANVTYQKPDKQEEFYA
ncbi:SDC3 protein, partial [Oreotrochilus melanogaster]|nr:SDC3 protein [Oreotrochilus melanogaster]